MRGRHVVGLVLAAVLVVALACTSDSPTFEPIPPCTPVEGHDPCDGDLSGLGRPTGLRGHGVDYGDEPWTIRSYLDGGVGALLEGHIAVRGQILPGTIRCHYQDHYRPQPLLGTEIRSRWVLKCYGDIQVQEYIVGTGPTALTAVVKHVHRLTHPRDPEAMYQFHLDTLTGRFDDTPAATGVESVFFLGPALETTVETWQIFATWDLERQEDETVRVIHPHRHIWQREPDYEQTHRSKVEMTLAAFRQEAQQSHRDRLEEYGGRMEPVNSFGTQYPMLVQDAAQLRAFYVETGAATRPVPPVAPPPPCGKAAVANQGSNSGLMLDCFALLEGLDELRGTGTLNWSVDTAIGSWDGVTVEGTPQRVTKLELANKSLTGTVPAALARLELTTLKLAGNSLTGCIPVGLQEVAVNDLDDLGLPDCAG